MTPRPLLALVSMMAALAVAPGAPLAMTLDQARCLCADDVRTKGDFVACMARMTRRLHEAGDLSREQRSREMVSSAQSSLAEIHALDLSCVAPPDGEARWGVGLQVAREVVAPSGTLDVEALLWNFTPELVVGAATSQGPAYCHLSVVVEDAAGDVVHEQLLPCMAALTNVPLPPGTVFRSPFTITADHLGAANGVPDGVPLPPGTYHVVLVPNLIVPNRDDAFEGLAPAATFRIVVE